MSVVESTDPVERHFLRVVYELSERKAKSPVPFEGVCIEFGRPENEADRSCIFWADHGVLEWPKLGHVSLTYVGFRRAERLAKTGWYPRLCPERDALPANNGPKSRFSSPLQPLRQANPALPPDFALHLR